MQRSVRHLYFGHLYAWKARPFLNGGKSGVTYFGELHAWKVGSILGYVGLVSALGFSNCQALKS
jgi:hypothetical protein